MFTIGDHVGDPSTRFGQATEFLPYPMWALCADRSLALYVHSATDSRYAQDGMLLDSLMLPPERALEITLDRVFRMAFRFSREQAPA